MTEAKRGEAMSADHMQKLQKVQKGRNALYDAAPFPGLLPRRISDTQSQDWGLDGVAAKIPEGRCVMIVGTKKP
jgi:hypothetical protein